MYVRERGIKTDLSFYPSVFGLKIVPINQRPPVQPVASTDGHGHVTFHEDADDTDDTNAAFHPGMRLGDDAAAKANRLNNAGRLRRPATKESVCETCLEEGGKHKKGWVCDPIKANHRTLGEIVDYYHRIARRGSR